MDWNQTPAYWDRLVERDDITFNLNYYLGL